MTWASRASNSTPNKTDYVDADTTKALQVNTVPAGFSTMHASHALTRSQVALYVDTSATPAGGLSNGLATRAQVEAVRTWDYTTYADKPASLTAFHDGIKVSLSWTNGANVPAWAQAITEVAIERDTGSGWVEIASPDWASSAVDAGGSVGDQYQVRYRCLRDLSSVSAYSNTATA